MRYSVNKIKRYGFIAAGLANIIGVLFFSMGFSNASLNAASPVVMSNFGLLMIIVWGLAYMAVSNSYMHVKMLVGVFAIEKLVYVVSWCIWMFHYAAYIPTWFDQSALTGIFMLIYGPNDLLFMFFFIWVFLSKDK